MGELESFAKEHTCDKSCIIVFFDIPKYFKGHTQDVYNLIEKFNLKVGEGTGLTYNGSCKKHIVPFLYFSKEGLNEEKTSEEYKTKLKLLEKEMDEFLADDSSVLKLKMFHKTLYIGHYPKIRLKPEFGTNKLEFIE